VTLARRLLELLLAALGLKKLTATRMEIAAGPITLITPHPQTRRSAMELLILTDEQKVRLFVRPKTAAGNPAKVDGVPVWSQSNAAVIDLVPDDDGMAATASATGQLGGSQISVVADADLGAGTRELTATQDVEIKAAEATALGIEAGVPEPK